MATSTDTINKRKEKELVVEDKLHAIVDRVEVLDEATAVAKLKDMLSSQNPNDLEIGGLFLKAITGRKKEKGGNVREWCETEFDKSYTSLRDKASAYTTVRDLNLTQEVISDIGWCKFRALVRGDVLTKENKDTWFRVAKNAPTVDDLETLIKKQKNPDGDEDKTPSKKEDPDEEKFTPNNDMKAFTFKLHTDQQDVVQQAIEKAKEDLETDYANVALTGICSGYLLGDTNANGSTSRVKPSDLENLLKMVGLDEAVRAFKKVFPEAFEE